MRFSDLEGLKIGVWGLGRETRSFLAHRRERLPGATVDVLVLENPGDGDDGLGAAGTEVVGPREATAALGVCDVLVRSPGVSIYRPELRAILDAGTPVTTPTALWMAERGPERTIGITGTKGKSTTAGLVAHLMRAAGAPTQLAGNIGRPALDLLDTDPGEWAVIELSSYQVADLEQGPRVALLTNLFSEHLDWHGSKAAYRRDKLRLFGLPGIERCVLPGDFAGELCPAGRTTRFAAPGGWHVEGEAVRHPDGSVVPLERLPLRGPHNAVNLCAALSALEAAGIERPELPDALEGFEAMPHRLQTVWREEGVEWVDDSISTTPESAAAALASFPERSVVLIAGGQDRGQDYGDLGRLLAAREATTLIGIPTTGGRLVAAALAAGAGGDQALEAADMAEAVSLARRLAAAGSVVVLSPAAPSYDSYRNFEERGEHFAALVSGGPAPPGP